MPGWWPKRSSKSKELQKQEENLSKSFEKSNRIVKEARPRSFDDVLNKGSPRISPRENNKNNGGVSGSSGFSGFDSDHKALPLPRPMSSLGIVDQTVGFGSGSGSVSSVSSSGSSEDQTQFGIFSRGHDDTKIVQPRSPRQPISPRQPRSPRQPISPRQPRSPGPGSRVTTTTSSPRHPRFSGTNLDCAGKLEDGKIEWHPLPLPPGSPTSPPTLPKPRTSATMDHSQCQLSKWKKGKLLGRGTFGHVYLGFNSESGQMCAIKEVRVVADDQTSKECLKQLNQEITLLSRLSQRNIV